jgi:hypothetical protein
VEEENKKESCCEKIKCSSNSCGGAGGGIYGLAFIGAAVYYIQNAETFWMGVLGVLKSLVWPAILVYNLLELLAK